MKNINSTEIKKILGELKEAPLELLGATVLARHFNGLQKFLKEVRCSEILARINDITLALPHSRRGLFTRLMATRRLRKPAKSADLREFESYGKKYEAAAHSILQTIEKDEELLAFLRRAPEEEAWKKIAALDAEERKRLSLLANLTKTTARGVTQFSLSATPAAQKKWLAELRASRIDPELYP